MQFLNEEHKQQYNSLLKRDKTHKDDKERQAMFYLLAVSSLYPRIDVLYDFEDRRALDFHIKSSDFSSSERKMITVAFNLFNGYEEKNMSPLHVFMYYEQLSFLVINAILIRFNLDLAVNFNR